MITKYDVGDKVAVEGKIEKIHIQKVGNSTKIKYELTVKDGSLLEHIEQFQDEILGKVGGVPIKELEKLYDDMGNIGVVIDGQSNILDSCRALLLDIVHKYEGEKE